MPQICARQTVHGTMSKSTISFESNVCDSLWCLHNSAYGIVKLEKKKKKNHAQLVVELKYLRSIILSYVYAFSLYFNSFISVMNRSLWAWIRMSLEGSRNKEGYKQCDAHKKSRTQYKTNGCHGLNTKTKLQRPEPTRNQPE